MKTGVSAGSGGRGIAIPPGPAADTTIPTTPANLTAADDGATAMDLDWDASTDAGAVVRYVIERKTTGAFAQIASVAAPITAFKDTGLTTATTYTYRVYAEDVAGNRSAYSAEASDATD